MIRTLFALLPPERSADVRRFFALAVVSVVVRAVGVVTLVPLVAALVQREHGRAGIWLVALTVATVIGWLVDYLGSRYAFELGFGVLDHAQHSVAERLSRIRLTWFGAENTATARQAVAATGPDLVGVVVYLVVPLVSTVLLPIVIGVALFFVAWQLAVVALLGVPLLLGALWATGAMTRRADHVADEANARLTERIVEFARTQHALRVSRRVEPERSLVGDALSRQHGATVRLLLMQIPGQLLFSIASQIALFALAGTAAWLTVDGGLSAPEAVALIVVAVRYLEPFTALGELAPGLETTRLTLRRIGAVLDAPTLSSGDVGTEVSQAPRIEFQRVGFDYGDPDHPVLADLDLVLEPGTATAIIGASGSGKSTVLGLIAGLYEPTAGRILVDGTDVATMDLEARRALVSVVFQEPYLMAGSVQENVLAGCPEADARSVAAATRLARVDEITARLPNGLKTEAGEGGSALSGGERQRVGIARALLKPAPVLLIDEATSALDNENERAVVDALSADDVPRTRVVVAHRRAGIRRVDRVIVLDGGRVVETGTPDALLAASGRFAEFWRHQGEGAVWKLTDR
ncbi:ATP-binding cassette domain-containing protein [Tsukamurella sp. 8F]|uniref:ABC transporter ATP-binding protein n=1 Tax=unclassified Tsukamurella TaxID=2633480 RepID=UPI0023BA2D6A|nr:MULTISPECIES: ATP-binding cassette domain-containing protein [unclassified Tsukamurella]MDF0528473.1 ATP-binding cassette domain-containing protein [Tsukamurella sp. 8J]MDF0586299.1 ATP-binding cassette domain-containing protein [Tsukamurella sp. 8F]